MSEAKEEGIIPSTKRTWLSRLNPLKRSRSPPIPDERIESPEHKANLASLITWQWINHLMFVCFSIPLIEILQANIVQVGYQRPLEENDIPRVNPSRSITVMAAALQANFEKRVKAGSKHALVGAIYETYKFEIVLGGLCCVLGSVAQIILPYLLKYLIAFATDAYLAQYTNQLAPSVGKGLGWVFGLSAMQILASIGNNQFMYRGMVVGGQLRAALISLIFSKAMTISGRARAGWKPPKTLPADITPGSDEEKAWYAEQLEEANLSVQGWSTGRIINLMSTDTNRIDKAAGWFHFIWTIPLTVLVTIALLLVNLTYSALPGIALFLLSTPFLGLAVKRIFRLRARTNKFTDERVSLTQEVLQAIRFVKYYAWETDFLDRISAIRRKEIHGVQLMFMIRNLLTAIGTSVPMFASMLAFITFSLTNHALAPSSVFSSLSLFNGLRLPAMMLPMVIALVTDASSAVTRIEQFLLAEDTDFDMQAQAVDSENAVSMADATFTWEKAVDGQDHVGPQHGKGAGKKDKAKKGGKKTEKMPEKTGKSSETSSTDGDEKVHEASTESSKEPFKIHDLNIQIARGEFLGVVGNVGSGKTSFLASLAGEMRKVNGDAIVGGSKAYCPQNAWIQNATVEANITFGQELDEEKFKRVVEACSLRHDLEILPNGRYTQIGERGINLSGGQKARISLARAIYADTDILLLDDPLSAVDAHVGRHIMENALCGVLKDKCRILATHQLHVLHHCDRIIMMDNGMIVANDTFDNLVANNERFKEMMTTVDQDHKEEDLEQIPATTEATVKKIASIAKQPQDDLIQEEADSGSGVSSSIYFRYYEVAGSIFFIPVILLLLILSTGGSIVTSLWLAWWTSDNFGYSTGTYVSPHHQD